MKRTSCGQCSQMKIYFLSALFHIILISTTSGCIASPYGDECLVSDFSDEFETFNISKWVHEVTMSGCGNGEFEMYVPDAANSFVQIRLFMVPTHHIQVSILVNVAMQAITDVSDVPLLVMFSILWFLPEFTLIFHFSTIVSKFERRYLLVTGFGRRSE